MSETSNRSSPTVERLRAVSVAGAGVAVGCSIVRAAAVATMGATVGGCGVIVGVALGIGVSVGQGVDVGAGVWVAVGGICVAVGADAVRIAAAVDLPRATSAVAASQPGTLHCASAGCAIIRKEINVATMHLMFHPKKLRLR